MCLFFDLIKYWGNCIIGQGGSPSLPQEGCTAPENTKNQLHAAVVELVALDRATIKYSTVQNWCGQRRPQQRTVLTSFPPLCDHGNCVRVCFSSAPAFGVWRCRGRRAPPPTKGLIDHPLKRSLQNPLKHLLNFFPSATTGIVFHFTPRFASTKSQVRRARN